MFNWLARSAVAVVLVAGVAACGQDGDGAASPETSADVTSTTADTTTTTTAEEEDDSPEGEVDGLFGLLADGRSPFDTEADATAEVPAELIAALEGAAAATAGDGIGIDMWMETEAAGDLVQMAILAEQVGDDQRVLTELELPDGPFAYETLVVDGVLYLDAGGVEFITGAEVPAEFEWVSMSEDEFAELTGTPYRNNSPAEMAGWIGRVEGASFRTAGPGTFEGIDADAYVMTAPARSLLDAQGVRAPVGRSVQAHMVFWVAEGRLVGTGASIAMGSVLNRTVSLVDTETPIGPIAAPSDRLTVPLSELDV